MMKKIPWIIGYLMILVGDLVTIDWSEDAWRMIFKPLLIPVLVIFFLVSTKKFPSPLKKWILLALIFSWAGDVLLNFEKRDPIFFLLGLSAFLLAHIFYILFFHFVRVRASVSGKGWLLVAVVIYYAVLINLLAPHLGGIKVPVEVYGVVISFMFMLALHMLFISNKSAGRIMALGAALFVTSDTLLAINKFLQPFYGAPYFVMISYALAQWLIVAGAVEYIEGEKI
jgi:uncharacterized membrane protein YhhN